MSWRRLPSAKFDNAVLRELPVDTEPNNFVRSAVPRACFSRVEPTPIGNPELVIVSPTSLLLAGIEVKKSSNLNEELQKDDLEPIETLVPFLAGNKLLPGSESAAQCYCGHQFGYFSGQLGDGAALYLGEVVTGNERWELQLKGSGLTPFSRSADGRKVLRSTLREFLCSENMHALGVPTTRAGSVVVSRETQVLRDIFYNGNAKLEPTAVVTRIAKSFIRFGSFEIFKEQDKLTGLSGPSAGIENKEEMMKQMLDFIIRQYFPNITGESKYENFFNEIVCRTAKLVAKWQSIGFCHGVLNTDNMSIVGDTLDYGPFGFMEHFDPRHICNTSDDSGRYRYEAQPAICKWNCGILADQLELVMSRADLEKSLSGFDVVFQNEYLCLMWEKLGVSGKMEKDSELVSTLFDVLAHTGADFSCTFRYLSTLDAFDTGESRENILNKLTGISETLAEQKRKLAQASKGISDAQYNMIMTLLQENPVRARQYGITPALVAEIKANREEKVFLDAITDEERANTIRTAWEDWLDVYIFRIKKEGNADAASDSRRRHRMLKVNPLFVLRNHVAQKAIDLAHEGNHDGVHHIFELLTNPFDEPNDESDLVYALPQDPSATPLCVSCSS
ncbi:Uncharacterized conserved protein (YdiU family) [Plasmopara halstedii]|uniref:Selenoprotein O n=1 Tax=Plasmopara halstedii TaxID=4781 RepID=A0A0N7L5S1_PLAHL|nr:Uncharacterized conserved protein (YdiU family) [Plasmopara halstedii]CEG42259.1 Uncharacterized conserved protein (YdiU family) [Plasmopara halstedii]|eukprot:XP_024578628.1 Uncharacterized conserved protein (YdiU family) [Plasmopara halstedii]